jgi:hypothetical protein
MNVDFTFALFLPDDMHTPIHLSNVTKESYSFTLNIVYDQKSARVRTPKATPAAAWYFGLFQLWSTEVHEQLRGCDDTTQRDAVIGRFLNRHLQNPEPVIAIQMQGTNRI